jgi:hypothetical protein
MERSGAADQQREDRPWCRVSLVTSRGEVLADWEIQGTGRPTIRTIGQLAGLQLAAQRADAHLVFTDVSPDLADLLEFCGLREGANWEIRRG